MTFLVGSPDWSEGVQLEVVSFNQALGAAPQTVQLDVSRWVGDIVTVSTPAGASADTLLDAQWLDTQGNTIAANTYRILACPSPGAGITTYVQHLGPTVKYTASGYTTTPTLSIVHTNVPPLKAAKWMPNMAGEVIYAGDVSLGANASNTQVMRGTGGALGGNAGSYCGPALMTARGSQDGPAIVTLQDVNSHACGALTIPQASGVPSLLTTPVMIPSTQWSVAISNGATVQHVIVSIVAT